MNDERLLTADQLAQRWGLHKATVLRMYHEGGLPGVNLCRGQERSRVRFRPAAVEAFERKRERVRAGQELPNERVDRA